MPLSFALHYAFVAATLFCGDALRLSISQSITSSSRTSSTSWYSQSLRSPDNGTCIYKNLLKATIGWMQQEHYLEPLGASIVPETRIVVNKGFQSDFPPGKTSAVGEGFEGVIKEQFPRRHAFPNGIVVAFGRSHVGFFPGNFDKLSKDVSYHPIGITYCDAKTVTLRKGVPDYNAFSDVEWEDESMVGQEITSKEAGYISNYAGSYSYAENVAKSVLNGLLPTFPDRSSGRVSWSSTSLDSLTEEVIKYDVMFATALNKLPYPSSQVSLFRGAWETPETIEHLMLSHRNQNKIAQSRFMSTTLAADHACNFFSSRNEPVECRAGSGSFDAEASGCVNAKARFPVRYEFQTKRAKDIQQWNEKEQEFMILPNQGFDVIAIEKVTNDRVYMMGPEELAADVRPSYPEVADAVLEKNIGGAALVAAVAKSPYRFVDTLLGYDMRGRNSWETGWPLEKHYGLKKLLDKDRFTLKCASMDVKDEIVDNKVPYYYRVVMKDSPGSR